MPFTLEISDPQLHPRLTAHRVVPIRFARAVDTFSDDGAPDLDDHGFTIPARFCSAKGPVVGLIGPAGLDTRGPAVRIQVIRDRLENSTDLFATIDDASVAEIVFPAAGSALNATAVPATATTPERPPDCVFVRAASNAENETKLKIRFGSTSGPVMAEMAVRVYPRLTITVQAHLVTINGVAPATSGADITRMFRDVGKVYAQAGVEFLLNGALLTETVTGFARAGTVTLTAVADARNRELQTVLRQNPTPGLLNAYFFRHYFDTTNGQQDRVLGIAFSSDLANANPPSGNFPGCQAGITVRDTTDPVEAAHTVAHEIGHVLRLIHYGGVNSPGRGDIWANRCLMHPVVGISASPPSSVVRQIVGYGDLADGTPCTGQLLTTKPRDGVRQSDEVNVLRQAVRDGTFMPV